MKCPYCGNNCPDEALYCDVCKQPLPTGDDAPAQEAQKPRRTPLQRALIVLFWVMCFVVVGIGIYKVVFWVDSYQITREYTRGAYTPTLTTITMADGQAGHALVFYGEDGDMVYLPETDECLSICGGTARLEIADSAWFRNSDQEYEYAEIRFAPVLMKADGNQIQLPIIEYSVDMPQSPLEVISPAEDGLNVVTSSYPLELQVVPGSSLFINGEDLTSRLDRSGAFSGSVSVRPIGDNTYSVIVRTPHHKEYRQDITLFREQFDIEIELDSAVSTLSTETTMSVSGVCEPGAIISVDTAYIEESLMLDMNTGKFSFIAKFEHYGENIVRFRASMAGRNDAVISFPVTYRPTLAQYSAKAWAMDYDQLRLYYETWIERVFLCKGPVIDKFNADDVEYLVVNVGTEDNQQLVILENQTKSSPNIGPIYEAYAHVQGRYFYNAEYYPLLTTLYMDNAQ